MCMCVYLCMRVCLRLGEVVCAMDDKGYTLIARTLFLRVLDFLKHHPPLFFSTNHAELLCRMAALSQSFTPCDVEISPLSGTVPFA